MLILQKKVGEVLTTPITDNFNDDSIDTSLWSTASSPGGTHAEQNQRMEVTRSSSLPGSWLNVGPRLQYDVRGDFDLQIDVDMSAITITSDTYWLQSWMAVSKPGLNLQIGMQKKTSDGLYSWTNNGSFSSFTTDIPLPANQLGLRLTRVGNVFTAWYKETTTWTSLATATGSTDNTFTICHFGTNSVAAPPTDQITYFDNVNFTADEFHKI